MSYTYKGSISNNSLSYFLFGIRHSLYSKKKILGGTEDNTLQPYCQVYFKEDNKLIGNKPERKVYTECIHRYRKANIITLNM